MSSGRRRNPTVLIWAIPTAQTAINGRSNWQGCRNPTVPNCSLPTLDDLHWFCKRFTSSQSHHTDLVTSDSDLFHEKLSNEDIAESQSHHTDLVTTD